MCQLKVEFADEHFGVVFEFHTMLLIIATVVIGAVIWYLYHKLTFWQRQGIPTPGLLYQWHFYRRELGPYDLELLKKLGPVYGTYEILTPILLVADPDLIKEVLVKEFQKFPNHKPFRIGVPIVDKNLFSLDGGDDWKRIRAIVTPTFTSGKLRGMDPIVVDSIENLKKYFGKAAAEGKPINVRKFYNSLSFDVILRCAYGAKVDLLENPDDPILKNFENLFSGRWDTVLLVLFPRIAQAVGLAERGMKPFKFFENLLKKLLDERKNSDPNKPVPNDFLQIMIDFSKNVEKSEQNGSELPLESAKKGLSNIEMMAQCLIFLLAGFDTTATIMACCAYHLAKHPKVQNQLIKEVSQIKEELTHDNISNLKYLEAVLKECFRLSPPAVRVERQCVAPAQLGKVSVKPGTIVSVPVFALHRDSNQYSDPEDFKPERFLEGGSDVNHHPYAHIPFGGGPRMCIAQRFALMEAKMALALVFQKYRFETVAETKLSYAPSSFDVLAPEKIMLRVVAH